MKHAVLDVYKKIIIEAETPEEIMLDDAEKFEENYVELTKDQLIKLFNEEFDGRHSDTGVIEIAGETYRPSEIFQDLRPEEYEKALSKYCEDFDIAKIDGRYYVKVEDADEIIGESTKTGESTEIKAAPEVINLDVNCEYKLKSICENNLYGCKVIDGSGKVVAKTEPTFEVESDAIEASKPLVRALQIDREMQERKLRISSKKD